MARKTKRDQDNNTAESLKCFANQPNINMTIPWIYEIAQNMANSREGDDSDKEEDKIEEDLKCFLNQPNINMTIPWIYQIYKSVKSGGSGGEGGEGGSTYSMEWTDLTGG